MERTRQLQPFFTKLNFKHIYGKNNKEADFLSKAALQKKTDTIYYNLYVDGHEGPPLV
jgi:hypothetical protein